MTLHLYFAKRYFLAFLMVFTGIFIMLFLIQMVEQLGRFANVDVGFGSIITLTLLDIPAAIYRILPLVAILAAISMFVALARSSEMVITRAAGRSALVSVLAPVLVAVLLGTGSVAVLNPIVAATSTQYEVLANRYLGTQSNVLSVSPEGLWLRQGNASGQTVIRAARANLNGTELYEATFLSLSDEGIPIRRIEAASAALSSGAWILSDTKSWQIVGGQNPELGAVTEPRVVVPTNLTREEIADSFGTPSAVPIWELPGQIEKLERAGFSARQYRVWYQMELALPLLLGAMVFVAAGFTLRPARFGQTGLMVVMALVLGFTLYFIRNMAQILGENGQIPTALAAWGPPAAAVLLPIGLLLHLEDG